MKNLKNKIEDSFGVGILLLACTAIVLGIGRYACIPFVGNVQKTIIREKVVERAKILDINDPLNSISDIGWGDYNGDGRPDYRVYFKDGKQQTYFHAGFNTEGHLK